MTPLPSSLAPTSSFKRFQGLDVLRGLAIFLVLINHTQADTIPQLPELHGVAGAIYWRLKNFGWTGVDLFFVLSGFLISGLLYKELETTGGLKLGRFWLRRAFKIVPSYLVLLIALAVTGASAWWSTAQGAGDWSVRLSHLLFFQNYLAANANGPTWSLAVEEHFYWFLPCLLLALHGKATARQWERRLLGVGLAIVAGGVVLRVLHARHGIADEDFRLSHFRFDSLFFGVVLQWLWRKQHGLAQAVIQHPKMALGLSALCISPAFIWGRTSFWMFTVGYSLLAVGYAMVLLVFVSAFERRELGLVGKTLAKIGTWSYNVYLWNFFLLSLSLPGYGAAQAWLASHLPHNARLFVAQCGFFMLVSILLGGLMTRLVEAPFLALRDRVVPARPRSTSSAPERAVPSPTTMPEASLSSPA